MDLVGEIVEKESVAPTAPEPPRNTELKKLSSFKQRKGQHAGRNPVQQRRQPAPSASTSNNDTLKSPENSSSKGLSEAEKIHQENIEKISSMTQEDIDKERQELLEGLNPQLVQSLIKRAEKREQEEHHKHEHAEGYGGWIGGMKTQDGVKELSHLDKDDIDRALGLNNLKVSEDIKSESTRKVRFDDVPTIKYEDLPEGTEVNETGWEDVDDVDELVRNKTNEVAAEDYQLINEADEELQQDGVHFPKPKGNPLPNDDKDLDINDPQFYEKLHDKYYPDLPKETSKLKWMTDPMPAQRTNTYESISDMRFDFHGNLIELDDTSSTSEVPTYLGLHHHSDNPHLPGYTLAELVHLSRSVVPGQRCLSIQMLGRILHKLGLHKYNILPVPDNTDSENGGFNDNVRQMMQEFEKMMWNLVDELRIIDSITEAADETKSKNMSVRNYAIEALWLWKQGGGNPYKDTNEVDQEMAQIL